MNTPYTQVGTYTSLISLVVMFATHYGFNVTADQIIAVITGLTTLYGIVYQAIQHYKLAKVTGSLPVQS